MNRSASVLFLLLLAACTQERTPAPTDTLRALPDTASIPRRRLGFAAVDATPPSCVTRADSTDARYLVTRIDTLGNTRGVGESRRLEAATIARVNGWLGRLTAQEPCGGVGGIDTLVLRDTLTITKVVTRTDTLTRTITRIDTVATAVSPTFLAATKADLDSVARDATAPLYSRTAQTRLRARVDSLNGKPVPPPPPAVTVTRIALTGKEACVVGDTVDVVTTATKSDGSTAVVVGVLSSSNPAVLKPVTGTRAACVAASALHTVLTSSASGLTAQLAVLVSTVAPDPTLPPVVVVPPVVVPDTQPVGAPPIRAELPRSIPSPVFVKAARVVRVAPPQDLQAALNAAVAGDSLVLTGTYTGNFVLPQRACGAGISVVGAAALPLDGVRVTPWTAGGFPKLVTPNSAPALATAIPTCGWRVVGIEVTGTLAPTSIQYGLVALGDGGWVGGGESQTSLAKVPQQIVLDRVWIHGSSTLNTARCLAINSASTVVVNSYLSDCHGTGFDSQALEGWNGPGPYLIENNYLEGAGENIMFGGADPGIPGLSPSDITVRRNQITKPTQWRGVWTVKNIAELKNARRVLYTGNVIENSWQAGQAGMAVVFKSSQDVCGSCTWQGTQDVTFEWNLVRNAHRGLNLQGYDNAGQVITDVHTARVTVENNLFTGIGTSNGIAPNDGWLMLLTHDLADITVRRNTFVSNTAGYGLALYTAYGNGAARRIGITENVFAGQSYYAIAGDGANHSAALNVFAGFGGWRFTGNVVSQMQSDFVGLNPAGNSYFPAVASLGVTASGSTLFPTAGVDAVELARRTAGVVITPPLSAIARAFPRSVPAPRLTPKDSLWLAHQPKSRDQLKRPAVVPLRRR